MKSASGHRTRWLLGVALAVLATAAPARVTGDQQRRYVFAPTGQQMPYRVYVPTTWDGKQLLPIQMSEGTGATPSLAGSRELAKFLQDQKFDFQYIEVDGDHGSMVPMVWPAMFEFFDRHGE